MNPTLKSFLTRAASALVALAIIIFLYRTYDLQGLKLIVIFAVVIGTRELNQILFKTDKSLFLKSLFFFGSILIFTAAKSSLTVSGLAFSMGMVLWTVAVLISQHKNNDLHSILTLVSKGCLGMFYVGLLPAFTYLILDQSNGLYWFIFLLTVVFSCDTLAYLTGVLIGKRKVMPTVSPKKSLEGSLGGLAGSAIAGGLCWNFFFQSYPLWIFIVAAVIVGFLGQFGDFFESLLKRVANVKDSGNIMPGHGGVLDRIDAVLFASPAVLCLILIVSHLLS